MMPLTSLESLAKMALNVVPPGFFPLPHPTPFAYLKGSEDLGNRTLNQRSLLGGNWSMRGNLEELTNMKL